MSTVESYQMKNEKVVIVSYYRWWDKRQKYFYELYKNKGYDVVYYVSSFNHITKKNDILDIPETAEIIPTPIYYSNFSLKRVFSNIIFSIKVMKKIDDIKPSTIIVLLPSNILSTFIARYSKKNNTKLIVDILDLWPESLPINKAQKIILNPLLSMWKYLRTYSIRESDLVILECKYYYEVLKNELCEKDSKILYLQKSNGTNLMQKNIDDVIKFVYLGSINHIIDIELMVDLLKKVNLRKNVYVDIIGTGEREDYFINLLNQNNIKFKFWGPIFDNEKKLSILSKAHFGLNIMKDNVAVGLTTKSVEYLESNLPLINSIPFDTEELIKEYGAGYNIKLIPNREFVNNIVNLTNYEYNILAKNSRDLFWDKFSTNNFKKKLSEILFENREDIV
ncbi:hypothetical protein AF63_05120 [Streptococcus uberis Ab71]|uniref:hypothetical protein n=1 Tax=Streptococcus uberis TaxID=1349 RepID=UPI00062029CE|nr:hypothetical protein [Streptococcus uberis]KKF42413.1 hypothetical protein AF63_05120 [Streptococcus uberis Ab71]